MIEPLCIAPVPRTPCVMSVVLFSVRVATSKSCMCMVTTAIHLACSVSSIDTSAVVSARARGVCSVPYSYKIFLQVDALRTVHPLEQGLPYRQWHPCSVNNWVHVHLYLMLFFGDYCAKQFFLQTDSLQTLPTHQNGQSLAKPNECDPSVLQMTVSTNCSGSR